MSVVVSDDVQMLLDGLEVGSISELRSLVELGRRRRIAADRLFVSEERTTLVRLWASGTVEVATRQEPGFTWGPPIVCAEEL